MSNAEVLQNSIERGLARGFIIQAIFWPGH